MRCRTAIRRASSARPVRSATARPTSRRWRPSRRSTSTRRTRPRGSSPMPRRSRPSRRTTSTRTRPRGSRAIPGVAHHAVRHGHGARGPVGQVQISQAVTPVTTHDIDTHAAPWVESDVQTASPITPFDMDTAHAAPWVARIPMPGVTPARSPAARQVARAPSWGSNAAPGDWAAFGMPSRRGTSPARVRYPSRLRGPVAQR